MTSFDHLGLSAEVLKGIAELGFETPSEIQSQAIPQLLLQDQDFIGLAQTGTGKTAAFGLPLLEHIDPQSPHTQALILAPTRELGQQIAEQLSLFSKYLKRVHVLPVYGGASITAQMAALKSPQQVIIATPGRLIDLIKRKAVRLERLRFLVLDEADEMLNMGFKEELDKILSYTPETKRVWLFSATMPNEIRHIVKKYMKDPVEVRVNAKNEVNVNIEHQYAIVKGSDKTEALVRFMDIAPDMRGVVFCRTKRETQSLAEELLKREYKADAIHGDLSQAQRDRVMKRFKEQDLQVLIATDVAARGIDVNDLSHVFHFSLPDDDSYYTHRSGRTARAGKSGISVAFIGGGEKGRLDRLAKQLGISFAQVMIPQANQIQERHIQRWAQRILETPAKQKERDEALLEQVHLLFGNLSKEELIAKLVANELNTLGTQTTSKDLNQKPTPGKKSSRPPFVEKSRSRRPPERKTFAKKKRRHWSN
ncbi:MAG: DEAD/DEAH box helicase [Bernardetiaceae bacterium]